MALSLMGLPTTNLTPGTTGSTVQQLQQWLVNNGYLSQSDMNTGPGIYGPKTQAAVTSLQRNLGVNTNGNDGYWGPATISAIQSSSTPTTPTVTSSSQAMNYGSTAPIVPTTTNTSNALSIPSTGAISGLSGSVSTPTVPTSAPTTQPSTQNTLTIPTSGTVPGLSGSLTTPATPTATAQPNLFPGALNTGTADYGSVKQLQDALIKMGYMTENEMYQGRGAYATNTVSGVQKLQNELKNKGFLTNIDSPGVFSQSTVDALGKYLSAPQPSLGSVSGAMNSLQNAQNALTTPSLPSLTNAGSTTPTLPSSGATTGSTTPSLTPTGMPTLPSVNGASTTTTPTTGGAISTTGTPSTGATSMTPAGQGTGAPTIGLPTIPQINTGATTPTTSTTPALPTAAGPSALEKQYQGLITPAQGEVDTQTMINNLLASKQMGLNSIADQAIPMNFITGQQSSVERRAQGQLIPLQQKMALLQAQRQSALEATKFALDREDKAKSTQTANAAKNEIVDVDGKKKLVNTITGDVIKDIGTSTASTTLTPAQKQGALNSVVDDFYKDPAVKNLSDASSGYNTLTTLTNKQGRTSADNIAAIYAFAKIMDPGSVVREGEYATVQKYAQAWAESFGMNVQRILSNQEFLTDEAMRNLASAAQAKYQSLVAGYNQVFPTYQKRIEDINNGIINTQLPALNTGGSSSGSSGAVSGYSW